MVLKGDEIPLLARVIAVADTFDALTTNRPYQKAHDPVDALQHHRTIFQDSGLIRMR